MRAHPHLYEINTWPWLDELSRRAGRQLTLAGVPDREWDHLAAARRGHRLSDGHLEAQRVRAPARAERAAARRRVRPRVAGLDGARRRRIGLLHRGVRAGPAHRHLGGPRGASGPGCTRAACCSWSISFRITPVSIIRGSRRIPIGTCRATSRRSATIPVHFARSKPRPATSASSRAAAIRTLRRGPTSRSSITRIPTRERRWSTCSSSWPGTPTARGATWRCWCCRMSSGGTWREYLRAPMPAAGQRILGGREIGRADVHPARRGLLGHGVAAAAAGIRLHVRQAALRSAPAFLGGRRSRAPDGRRRLPAAFGEVHREPRRTAQRRRVRRSRARGGGRRHQHASGTPLFLSGTVRRANRSSAGPTRTMERRAGQRGSPALLRDAPRRGQRRRLSCRRVAASRRSFRGRRLEPRSPRVAMGPRSASSGSSSSTLAGTPRRGWCSSHPSCPAIRETTPSCSKISWMDTSIRGRETR